MKKKIYQAPVALPFVLQIQDVITMSTVVVDYTYGESGHGDEVTIRDLSEV